MKKQRRVPSLILAAAMKEETKRQQRQRRISTKALHGTDDQARHRIDAGLVFQTELSGLKEGTNDFAWAVCPFHNDHNPSLCVNLASGWYKCQASHCGETGSNIVSFVASLHGLNFAEAREYLEASYA